jgi:hypothetical protein
MRQNHILTLAFVIFSVLVTSSLGDSSPESYQYINIGGKTIVESGKPLSKNNVPQQQQEPQQQQQQQQQQRQQPQPPRPTLNRFSPISRLNNNNNKIQTNRVFTRPISQPVPQPVRAPVFERAQERFEVQANPRTRGQISVADYPATDPASSSYGK